MASSERLTVFGGFCTESYLGVTRRQARIHEYLSLSENQTSAAVLDYEYGCIPHGHDAQQSGMFSVLISEERHADVDSLVLALEALLGDRDEHS